MHKSVLLEYERLQKQYPGKEYLDLDECSEFFRTNRQNAARFMGRTGIPKYRIGDGKKSPLLYALTDIAEYLAKRKQAKGQPLIQPIPNVAAEMRSRRGFAQKGVKKIV